MSREGLALDATGHTLACREGVVTTGLRRPVPCCRRSDGASAEVSFTACSWTKRWAASGCPTAVSSPDCEAQAVDMTAVSQNPAQLQAA